MHYSKGDTQRGVRPSIGQTRILSTLLFLFLFFFLRELFLPSLKPGNRPVAGGVDVTGNRQKKKGDKNKNKNKSNLFLNRRNPGTGARPSRCWVTRNMCVELTRIKSENEKTRETPTDENSKFLF